MNDTSVEIKNTFTNLVKIYSETSSLLLDADTYLEEYGFTCAHSNNTLATEQSKHINLPSRWITYHAGRYFNSESHDKILLGLSVFYLNARQQPIEPILVFGVFDMKLNEDGDQLGYAYWYIKEAWFNFKNEFEFNTKYEIKEKLNFDSVTLMAIKLTDIKSQEGLKNNVISPLIEFIE